MTIPIFRTLGAAAIVSLCTAGAAAAHHSYAAFDRGKTVTVTGVVEELEWTNPHMWIFLQAPGPGGKMERWAIEANNLGAMVRAGWKAGAVKAGDKITMTINPMKDGRAGGHYVSAILPGNVTVGAQ